MTAIADTRKTPLSDFQRLVTIFKRYVLPYWKSMCCLQVINFLVTFLTGILPLIMAPILDIALGKHIGGGQEITIQNLSLKNLGAAVLQWLNITDATDKFRILLLLGGIYVLIGLLRSLASFGSYLLVLWIGTRSGRDMQYDLFKHILSLSLGFFNKQRTGELVSRLDDDTNVTTYIFERTISNLITAPVLILFYGALLLRTNPKLSFAAVGAALLHYAVTKGIKKPIRRQATDQFSFYAELRARLQEALLSIRVVKSFSAENFELRKLGNAIRNVIRINMKYGVYKNIEQPLRGAIDIMIEISFLLLAAYEMFTGRLDVSAFFLFLYVGRSIMAPLSTLGASFVDIQATLASSERVFQLFSEKRQVEDGPDQISAFCDSIQIEGVSFAYDTRRVLEEVSLEIRKGEIVALVGPSGAGKSTLSDLILRFYDPLEGRITIDNRDLRTLKQESYRRLFGVVPQEPLLFNATVRENIAYGRDDLTEEDIVYAARTANAHEFIITELPQGYNTLVGDRGIRLSGGQRQRVAIARAMVHKPQILILDEATSSLDSESERLVQQAIDQVLHQTTAIVIAHRLSTVVNADKIVVMDQGRIVDQGKHSDLLQRCELYQRLCHLQFGLESLPDA
jgi:subfamily B ATP-binding cassette protein MsbA